MSDVPERVRFIEESGVKILLIDFSGFAHGAESGGGHAERLEDVGLHEAFPGGLGHFFGDDAGDGKSWLTSESWFW